METQGRRLVVMRHARAESLAAEDHERRLTDRGRRDAEEAGRWLAGRQVVPDHAFVSSAARAVTTWEAVELRLRSGATVAVEDALYSAGPESAIQVLRTAPEDAAVLMFVGHNPTIAYLAHVLDDGTPDPSAFRDMSAGYRAAALTVLDVGVPWSDLAEGCAHIAAYHVGDGSGE